MVATEFERFEGAYAHLNGPRQLRIRQVDLARAMISVGYQNCFDAIHQAGLWRAIGLSSHAFGYFDSALRSNKCFASLEGTEQGGVTFLAASGLTLLGAEEGLAVRHLLHLRDWNTVQATQAPQGAPSKVQPGPTEETRMRPDFVGFDHRGAVHAVESKGSFGLTAKEAKVDGGTVRHALDQVSRVGTVNGRAPVTKTAHLWSISGESTTGRIIDPESVDAFDLTFDLRLGLQRAYAAVLSEDFTIRQVELPEGFVGCPLPGGWLAADAGALRILQSEASGEGVLAELNGFLDERADTYARLSQGEGASIGRNGIALFWGYPEWWPEFVCYRAR